MKILYRAAVTLLIAMAALVPVAEPPVSVPLVTVTLACVIAHEAVLIRQRRGFYR